MAKASGAPARGYARRSCPFCGHPYTDMVKVPDNRRGHRGQRPRLFRYYVECCAGECGRGPMGDSRVEATKLWDRRWTRDRPMDNVVQLHVVR